MDKKQIEELTMAYIHSYNIAMVEVKNPEFASQIAMNIIASIIMTTTMAQQKQKLNPLEMLFSQIAEQTRDRKKGDNDDRTENETN